MFALAFTSLLLGQGPANPLLDDLLTKGLALPQGVTLRLPPPAMKDGLTSEQQREVIKKAAGNLPLDLFLKKSDAAPFTLKINSVDEAAGKRIAQTVDLAFIGHGDLDRVIKQDVLNQLLGTDAKKGKGSAEVKFLGGEDLVKRGITSLKGPSLEERFALLDIFLLEKVKITGVTRNVKTHGMGWAVLAMRLDERFENDKQYPNQWRLFDALADKEDAFGAPHSYGGLGGYARVTSLSEPSGALFFELHVALHEPQAWFGGPNLLRSKLPLVLQENIRKLRRKLAHE